MASDKPQLIALKNGFFHHAELVRPIHSKPTALELEGNLKLSQESIEPRSLELLASYYLGPGRFKDEEPAPFEGHSQLDHRIEIINYALSHLIGKGEAYARGIGASHFYIWTKLTNSDTIAKLNPEIYHIGLSFGAQKARSQEKLTKEKIYELHPTVNLYIPRAI